MARMKPQLHNLDLFSTPDTRQTVGYLRVSTEKQGEEGNGLEIQEQQIKDYVKKHNQKIDDFYVDTDSGATIKRHDLQRLLKDVKAGKIKEIIAAKIDRFSRSMKHLLNLIEDEILVYDCKITFVDFPLDLNTKHGRLLFNNIAGIAAFERETIRERTESGYIENHKKGRLNGVASYGYFLDRNTHKAEIDPTTVHIVREIFTLALNPHLTWKEMADILNKKGYRSKKGDAWCKESVGYIINNPFYCGKVCWRGHFNQGEHEAIITEEQFNKIKNLRNRRKNKEIFFWG